MCEADKVLQDVIAAELGALTKKKLKEQLDPTRAPVSNNEAAIRMAEELFTAQDELYDEDSDEDVTAFGANNAAVTRDGKMTIAQRNRQARARERRAEEEANRLAKRQRRDLSNLKEVNARLEAKEAAAEVTEEGLAVA